MKKVITKNLLVALLFGMLASSVVGKQQYWYIYIQNYLITEYLSSSKLK